MLYKLYKNKLTKSDTKKCIGTNIVTFALISAMLHKPHNIILNFGLLLTCSRLNDVCDRLFSDERIKLLIKTVGHFWVGKMFFFYQVRVLSSFSFLIE